MNVTLSLAEVRVAAVAGAQRRIEAMAGVVHEVYGKADPLARWDVDIEAVGAEIAVAKALGRYWGPAASAAEDRAMGDLMDGVQVRSTQYRTGRLILHPRDSDDHRFVLVVGTMPDLEVVGWIDGAAGKDQRFWDTSVPRPAFFVPQRELLPIRTLDA